MMQRRGSVNNSAASARIRVAVRVRPPDCKIPKDETRPPCVAPSPNPNTPSALEFRHDTQTKTFTFDHVYGSNASQDDVYAGALQPLLAQFLDGYNVTVMAYGQTGSGKTYTMGNKASVFNTTPTTSPCRDRGSSIPPPMIATPETRNYQGSADDGLMPRFLNDLFVSLKREPSIKEIRVTFVEIYLDTIRDLLDDRPDKSLSIREDAHNVWVENVRSIQVDTLTRALEVLNAGRARQTVGMNALNDESSRSHAVYTMEVSRKFSSEMKKSKLTFVDLAGSERIKKTEVEGPRRRESIQINVGLSSLGNVINALADQRKLQQRRMSQDSSASRPSSPDVHIPYRSSKLTRLLRDGLGGNARTLIIACVSPLDSNADETINTLQFANRARSIQNKAEKNVNHELYVVTPNPSDLEIARLQENIKTLQQQIADLEAASRKREDEIASAEQARIQRKEKKRDDRRDAEMTTEVAILPHVDAHTQHEGESTGEKRPTNADADTMTDCFDDTPAKTATVDICVQFGVTSSELVDMAIMTDPDRRFLATETCTVFDLVAKPSIDTENQRGASYLHLHDIETSTDLGLCVATCDASTEYFTAEITDSACQHDPPAPFADAETLTDISPVVETAEMSTDCALQLVHDASSQSDASCLHNVDVSVSTDSFPESVVEVGDGPALVDTASQHESPISSDVGVEAIPEAVEVGTDSVEVPVAEIACQSEVDMPDHVEIGTITDPEAIAHTTDASTDCVLVTTTDEASQCGMPASHLIECGMATDPEPVVSIATVSTECCASDRVHTASQCDHADQTTELLRTGYVSIVDKSGDAVLHSNIDGTVSPDVSNIARPDVLAAASEDGPDDCFPAGVNSEDAQTLCTPPACLSPTASISTLSDTCDITPSVDAPATIDSDSHDKKLSIEDLITDKCESSTELWKSVKRPDLSPTMAFEPAIFSSLSDSHSIQDVFDVTHLVYDTGVLEAAAEVKSTKVARSLTPEAEEDEHVHAQSENQREVGAGDHRLFVCCPLNEDEEDMLGVQTIATRGIVNSEPVLFEAPATGSKREDCTSRMEYASDFIPSTLALAIKPPAIQNHDQSDCGAAVPRHLDSQDIPLPPPAADFVVVRSPRRGNRAKPQGVRASQRISPRGAAPKRAVSPSSHHPVRPLRIFAFDDDTTAATPEKTSAQAKNLCENLRQLARDEFGGDADAAEPDELQQAPALHTLSTVGQLITETKEFINRRQKRQQRIAQLRSRVLELEDVLQVEHRAPISEPELKAYSERVQEEFLCKLSQQLITLAAERLHFRLKARVEAEQLMPLPSGADDDGSTASPFLNLDQCQACAEWFFRRADDAVFFEKQVLPLITSCWIPLTISHLEAEQAWFQL